MKSSRAGFSLVEVLVSAGGALLVAALASGFLVSVSRAASYGHARSDGLESVMLAGETLRRDAARLLFKESSDLTVGVDGHSVSMLVVSGPTGSDLWFADGVVVSYRLVPARGQPGAFWLERTDASGSRVIPGCVIGELTFKYAPQGELSARGAFLEITITGVSGGRDGAACSTHMLVRIAPVQSPGERSGGAA